MRGAEVNKSQNPMEHGHQRKLTEHGADSTLVPSREHFDAGCLASRTVRE
jgi:hypothetical protein